MEKIVLGAPFFTNCYIVDSIDSCFIIDPGSNYDLIKSKITKKIEFVLLTHGHSDHIDMIGMFDCPIYISKKDYDFLFDYDKSCYNHWNEKPSFDPKKLDIKIIDDNITFNNQIIKVIETPGHTIGSVCYLYKDKLFSGDTLFKESIGRCDLPTGNEKVMKKTIVELIDSLDDSIKVYPGHGDNSTIHYERLNNQYYIYYKKQMSK